LAGDRYQRIRPDVVRVVTEPCSRPENYGPELLPSFGSKRASKQRAVPKFEGVTLNELFGLCPGYIVVDAYR
jgi:hypothetical protein